ncbi:MAG: cupin domain-containing protein [Mangrovicoccus sp.]|nr:cupin domain-containing protein [Mangrovicoccus sp.]
MPVLDPTRLPRLDAGAPPDSPFARLSWLALGDAGGLTQFGVSLETLGPGGRSSDRHWHEAEDEFAYVLSGTLTLVEDTGEATLGPGEAAAFPAGNPVGHTLENRTDAPAVFLMIGTRAADDRVHYALLDRIEVKLAGRKHLTRRDGTPLS